MDKEKFIHHYIGYCYQFNTNGTEFSKIAGRNGGIEIVLDAQTNEYTLGPTSFAAGFDVSTYHYWSAT